MHGRIKKRPGPFAPDSRPSLKITARSYSATILMVTIKDNGNVTMTKNIESPVKNISQHPASATSSVEFCFSGSIVGWTCDMQKLLFARPKTHTHTHTETLLYYFCGYMCVFGASRL